jgi:outer membrane usher protein
MRSLAVLIALSSFAARCVLASEPEFTAVVLDIRLNQEATSTTLVVQRDAGGGLWLDASDLERLRVRQPDTPYRSIDGGRYYPLDSFGDVSFDIDPASQSAAIMLPPDAFVRTQIGRTDGGLAGITTAAPGGFLNYDVALAREAGATTHGAQLELGFFDRDGVVTSTFVASDATTRRVTRLETAITRDFPDALARLTLGDSISTSGAWGQAARFVGVQYGTNFATQPTLVTTPLLGADGVALVPSTVDVFVNGQRMSSAEVPPGPFSIDRLPAINGAGEMQVVITDVLGREQIITQPYYSGPALMRAGLDEYSFEVGALRQDFGVRSNHYDSPLTAATWRRGFTDAFTGEGHVEIDGSGTGALGVEGAVRIGRLGILTTTLAGSQSSRGTGVLSGAGFEHNASRLSLFTQLRFASAEFSLVGSTQNALRPKMRAFMGAGWRLGRAGSVSAAYARQAYWNAERVDTLSASWSLSIRDLGYLSLSAAHSRTQSSGSTDVYLLFTMPLGSDHTASLNLEHASDRPGDAFEASATLQKSRPPGSGYSYYSMLASSGDYALNTSLHGRAGVASVELARHNDLEGQRLQAQGGLAFTSLGMMPGRRLDQSFAIIEAGDYAGLTVYLENQPIGRTDEDGRLLIDRLRAYEENQISLDPTEVPIDAALDVRAIDVVPAWRSGPIVRFPIERAHAATLHLVRVDGTPVPAGASVTVGQREFAVALDGLVYLDGVATATTGRAHWADVECTFPIDRAASDDPIPDLGRVLCSTGPGAESRGP